MTTKTHYVLQTVLNDWQGRDRRIEEWQHDFDRRHYDLSFATFRKYAVLEEVENLIPVSLEELVALLNDCAGDDCYACSWEYVVRDGHPFQRIMTYRLIDVNFS